VRTFRLALLLALCCPGAVFAAELKVLSAGVGELGLRQAIPAYEKSGGDRVTVGFAVPKLLKERVLAGEPADVLIAPSTVIDAVLAGGKALEPRLIVGQVGVGVVVRKGDTRPAIATPDEVKKAATGATSVIYNRASTGLYLDQLFERLGITQAIAGKVQRYADGDAVMRHIVDAPKGSVGFGAIAEIRLYTDKGADYVGPLPAQIQNYTRYEAVRLKAGGEGAAALLRFLGTPQARGFFAESGVEPVTLP
jgi:molybdate transport system substrate-binding protein